MPLDMGERIDIQSLLHHMIEKDASDLHISAGSPPRIRIQGRLVPLDMPNLTPSQTKEMAYSILTEQQKNKFEEMNELDFSFGIKGLSRFRGNVFVQRGAITGVFRAIPFRIRSFEELGLPQILAEIAQKPRGLVLVTGPTGSGKSTTLAAMIDKINEEREDHIITVEDPIEYVYQSKRCLVNQREIGQDTYSFGNALKYVLRQDPDVVLLGEMRDKETIQTALTIAETGHLCLATLHTNSCVQTMNRIIDVFSADQQAQVRAQLSFVLEGVVSQMLLPTKDKSGRIAALEIMLPNAAIRNLIREDKVHQIYSQMQVGQTKFKMQTMNQSFIKLLKEGMVNVDDLMARSPVPDEFRQMVSQTIGLGSGLLG